MNRTHAPTATTPPRPSHSAPYRSRPTQALDAPPPPAAAANAAGDPRMLRILLHIEQHIGDPDLGATRLQRSFGVSRPTLYRMFQPVGGVSRYIRERRLLAAHQRLRREPGSSITFLLYDLGFESERQFQRAFQACFGMSPAQWREHCRAEAPPRALRRQGR
ncbi:helix-turn-helix domain-containing protein [Luteimonas huabeiensis]|uniref:helix-turn-helix domain-containing protein n=1 Tax=Luteimonas huabeiensis TaxID=1244513 RepID=UPI000464BF5D|nr:helix-turn-helix domain-containing protein [Luteimonas huabeiensis]